MSISTESIERQLDRIQSFIPRVDTRISAFFAILSGQIAIALVNINTTDVNGWGMLSCLAWFAITSVWAMLNMYQSMHPDLDNDRSSLVFFGDIQKWDSDKFSERFRSIGEEELRDDLCHQIWRNSQIVSQKYSHLKRASSAVLVGTLPWSLLLFGVSALKLQLP